MIKAFKRWLAKAAYEGLSEQKVREDSIRTSSRLGDMMSDSGATLVAFQINNGFVVRTLRHNEDRIGGRYPGFVYCADHQAIADHIVSSAMKDRLGVQQDMFAEQRKQVNIVPKSKTAGLVGAQQANPSY
jgi:hypothetical protein